MKRRGFLGGLFAMAVAPFCPKFRTDDNKIVNMHGSIAQSIYRPMRNKEQEYWEGTNIPTTLIPMKYDQIVTFNLQNDNIYVKYDDLEKRLDEIFPETKGYKDNL